MLLGTMRPKSSFWIYNIYFVYRKSDSIILKCQMIHVSHYSSSFIFFCIEIQHVHYICDVLYASSTCQMVYGLLFIYIIHPHYHVNFWNPSKIQSSSSSMEHLVYWVLISWFVAILFILYYHQF